MRKISAAEMLHLRELMQMETTALAKAKAMGALVRDEEFSALVSSGIQAGEVRLKGMQQFMVENHIIEEGVH